MKVVIFVISFLIFAGSIYMFDVAFQVEGDLAQLLAFFAGIIGVCVAFAIPIHLLKRTAP